MTETATADSTDLRRDLESHEVALYREWNTSAGTRGYGVYSLPWMRENLERVISDPEGMEVSFPGVVRTDFEAFRRAQTQIVHLRRPLDPDEIYAYSAWNESAGRRTYPLHNLPWGPTNLQRALVNPGALPGRFGDTVWLDFEAFRRDTGRLGQAEPAKPWTPPADPNAPIEVTDPRVRYLWVEAAKVARTHAMCGTYDSVARAVGVPSREELRRTGEIKRQMILKYRLALEVTVDNPEGESYHQMHQRKVTADTIRAELAKSMALDDETLLRILGGVHDYTNLE